MIAFTRSSEPSTAPPALWRHWPEMQNWPVSSKMSPAVQTPLSSAAVAVIDLNVEPVGPALWNARFTCGSPEFGPNNEL